MLSTRRKLLPVADYGQHSVKSELAELSSAAGGGVVWRPSPELIGQSNLHRFMAKHGLRSLPELHRRSITELDWFWNAVLDDLQIQFRRRYSRILDDSRGPAWAQWCLDGVMNIVDNCLDKYAGTAMDQKIAVRWEGEEGRERAVSYAQLRQEVNRMANALLGLGLKKGDVIGVFMPMIPEIVAAMLAIIKIGAIFLPLFSGFGPQAVGSRLADAEAKALFTTDGCLRRGKIVPMKPIADGAVASSPALRHMIVVRRTELIVPWTEGRDHWWHELTARAANTGATEATSADDIAMLIYTSGTTGRPKGAVHTHCGFPIKAAQDLKHGFDLHPDETLYWVTDMGWMMGPWLVFGTLLLGATMLIYDGAPDWPEPDRLWALVERHRVTTLGVSPTLVRALLRYGDAPVRNHNLASLRKFGSTGEPWNPDPWLWLFGTVGQGKLPIINYSGGTEISGGILGGNVLTPLIPCAFSGPLPGMAAEVVDANGHSVKAEVGELIIRKPWMGMTRGFWRDPQRYLETYWSRWPETWVHGDWAITDEDGFWFILGRSDDTIKTAGKRIGPAEIESVLVAHPAVLEAAAIGLPDEIKGEALACFCVLKPGCAATEGLRDALKGAVEAALGKALAPKQVEFIPELPKTRNGKVMRRLIRAAYLGHEPGDTSSLENPRVLETVSRLATGHE